MRQYHTGKGSLFRKAFRINIAQYYPEIALEARQGISIQYPTQPLPCLGLRPVGALNAF